MRPAMLDFTKFQQPEADPNTAATASGTGASRVKAPVNLEGSQTQPATSTKPAPAEEPKKGFFQRLFKK
jgi:hypothetical protein